MMSKKQIAKNVTRKLARGFPNSRRIRLLDPATYDSGKVRFGTGMAPAALRK